MTEQHKEHAPNEPTPEQEGQDTSNKPQDQKGIDALHEANEKAANGG